MPPYENVVLRPLLPERKRKREREGERKRERFISQGLSVDDCLWGKRERERGPERE
jgi:hypothetical protein